MGPSRRQVIASREFWLGVGLTLAILWLIGAYAPIARRFSALALASVSVLSAKQALSAVIALEGENGGPGRTRTRNLAVMSGQL